MQFWTGSQDIPPAPPRILLLEDDPAIARTVIYALERSGLQVTHCLMVLDVGLPDGSGLDVCRQVRAQAATPVLMLSAHGEEIDRVLGLELAADDYVTKPFSPRELVARVRGLLRRAAPTAAAPAASPGLFTVDTAAQRASLRSQPLDLTRREFGLLGLALSNRLENAAAFSPAGSAVRVEVQATVVPVADSGPGAPDFALPHLGERFFSTVHPDGVNKGSGLGLAIVRQIMALHGGGW